MRLAGVLFERLFVDDEISEGRCVYIYRHGRDDIYIGRIEIAL